MLNIETITPATVQPVGLPQIKDHLRIDHTDEDAHLTLLSKAATAWCENLMHRAIMATGYRLSLSRFPVATTDNAMAIIRLPQGNTQSIESVSYIDTNGNLQALTGPSSSPAGTDFQEYLSSTLGGAIWPAYGYSWPSTREQPGAVRIEFTAGFGAATKDIPPDIIHAVLFRLTDLYEARGSTDLHPTSNANFEGSAYSQAARALVGPWVIPLW